MAADATPRARPRRPARSLDMRKTLLAADAGQSTLALLPGANVFRQGDGADAVFYIERGEVQINVTSKQGKSAIVALQKAGAFFGEGCLTGQRLRVASATTMAPSTLIKVEKSSMTQLLREDRGLAAAFIAYLLTRNSRVEQDLVDQMFNSSERRLARLLLLLTNFGESGHLETVVPKVSQDVLAGLVGTTRSRINHFMNKFRRLGYIDYNGTLKVHASLLNMVVQD